MYFNSIDFFIFLSILLPLYWLIKNTHVRNIVLLIASSLFYMSWNVYYIFLIFAVSLVDFSFSHAILRTSSPFRAKLFLTLAITINLLLLVIFKYSHFFVEQINHVVTFTALPSLPVPEILLPAGISFYIFQSMSTTIDVYRSQLKPERSYIKYSLFVTFFPQLVAGPIVRAKEFLWQIDLKKIFLEKRFQMGVFLIITGLVKKVVIADFLSLKLVDGVFANPHLYTSVDILFAIYSYAFQIYNDFSGYSDIAIGTAMLFGFKLPINFNSPYKATSVRDFWRRWHISLSTWIRDYVYVSLGGNRLSSVRLVLNLIITWLLCGLWHGAAWHFVIWGALHGAATIVEQFFRKIFRSLKKNLIVKIISIILTFHFISLGWVFFRAESISVAIKILHQLFFSPFVIRDIGIYISSIMLLVAAVFHFLPKKFYRRASLCYVTSSNFLKFIFLICATALIAYFSTFESTPFIYFQF